VRVFTLTDNAGREVFNNYPQQEEVMTKKMLSVVLLMAIATVSTFAQKGPGPQGSPHANQKAIFKMLKLTDAQELQMQKLRLQLMKKQTQLRAKVQGLRLDNKELFLADKVDRKAVEGNVKSISDMQEQMKLNMIDHWFDVNTMLNADQQKLWKKHAIQMGEQLQERFRGAGQERVRMRIEKRFDDRDIDD
jgi:Spy/CpxP family protein refolding chaperone